MKSIPKVGVMWIVYVLALCFSSNSSHAAFDLYLKIDGVLGESTERNHADWIQVEKYSQKMTQTGSFSGGGGGAGRAIVGDFIITKRVDKSSPLLSIILLRGEHIRQAILEVVRPRGDDKPTVIQRITLEDIILSSMETGGPAQDSLGLETVGFNIARIKWEYFTFNAMGQSSGSVVKMWDVQNNREVTNITPTPSPTLAPPQPTATATPRPTATKTPTPRQVMLPPAMAIEDGGVVVTDDFYSTVSLIGGEDTDPVNRRELMIRWNLNVANAVDYHIYVQIDGSTPSYLGRTGSGSTPFYLWTTGAENLSPVFSGGPQSNHEYLFTVYALVPMDGSSKPVVGGKWSSREPVNYIVE